MFDPPIGECGVQELGDPELMDLLPHLPRQAVHEVEVDMIGLQALQLLIEEPVHVRPGLDEPTRQLGRQENVRPLAFQGLAQEHLAHARLEGHF